MPGGFPGEYRVFFAMAGLGVRGRQEGWWRQMRDLWIDVFGIHIRIGTNCEFVFQNLAKDFALFRSDMESFGNVQVTISTFEQIPPYDRVPPIEASLYDHGLICYKKKNINYVVYSCDGLLIYNFSIETGDIFGTDKVFLYEKTKLTLLSRLGELLDRRGLHRIHAFGISYRDKTLICLIPMEGGKTTTVLNLLKADPAIQIVADDLCFIDRKGILHPFLMRLGARDPDLVQGVPPEFVNEIERPYYGVKYFIEPTFFKDRIGQPTRLTHILVGKRAFCPESKIEPISKIKAMGPLLESGIFGVGLPQLLEFFVRGGSRMFFQRAGIVLSRIFFCLSLQGKTKTFAIKIGLNKKATRDEILRFLKA